MILAAIIVICSLLASTIVHCGDEISEIVYSYVLFASMLIIIIIIIITQPLFLLSFHARGFVLEGKKNNNEKALRETQTLRAGCSKAEPKNFAPPQTPSRGRGTAKI